MTRDSPQARSGSVSEPGPVGASLPEHGPPEVSNLEARPRIWPEGFLATTLRVIERETLRDMDLVPFPIPNPRAARAPPPGRPTLSSDVEELIASSEEEWRQLDLPPYVECRSCGCTEERPCPGSCWWVEPDLCSRCAALEVLAPGEGP